MLAFFYSPLPLLLFILSFITAMKLTASNNNIPTHTLPPIQFPCHHNERRQHPPRRAQPLSCAVPAPDLFHILYLLLKYVSRRLFSTGTGQVQFVTSLCVAGFWEKENWEWEL
ncbi:hypothetical protein K469DRAFT_207809 [Zopfia rhizophila CBS 207.26]|uniref:Uncharacterized protein n=1 Tax=Zopfia rhizophila CBS 207.26 TaxID=1314779 RepID=A0A6A6DV40_9PEZI|nr:hypothetical protein K469DRAFT_207809 [Zopfia rhizophila CBS 207.26]